MAANSNPVFSVTTQSKSNDIGIVTLLGDYSEAGMNHGRKYYKKLQKIKGHEDISVFLYYWDQRDGADFGGWWFGDQLGGSQVWARANSHGDRPPRLGWKIPWDAPKAEPGILFCDPASSGKPAATPAAATTPAKPANSTPAATASPDGTPLAERVQRAAEQVESAERESADILARAAEFLGGEPEEAAIKDALEMLQTQQKALIEVQTAITKDVAEARKAGPAGTGPMTELSKLSPKVRLSQGSITAELNKVRAMLTKVQANAKAAEAKEQQKKAEEHDSKELDESLPAVKEVVNSAEEGVSTVVGLATPALANPPGDDASFNAAMDEIESTASEAQEKITEARKQINLKLQAARTYAPETKKRALTECSALQQKLTEGQARLNPYKNFRKDFHARVEAKKQLSDTTQKMDDVELEVEKASMVTGMSEKGTMSDEDVSAAEEMILPLLRDLANEVRQIDAKMRAATGPLRDELQLIKDRANNMKKKLDSITLVLKRQREGKTVEELLALAEERVDLAEQSLAKCHEAEMPFLKGLEILPQEESTKAIKDSEEAAIKSDAAVNQATVFIKTKLGEAKRLSADLIKSTLDSLTELMTRTEAARKKLMNFKKETVERKMASLLAEVVDGIVAAEKKVEVVVEAGKLFMTDSLDKITADGIKEAIEKTAAVEAEATAACTAAKQLIIGKQKDAKGPEAAAAVAKLQARLNAAQAELNKQLKAASTGEKLVSGKELVLDLDEKIKEAESEVDRIEDLAKPIQCDEGEELSDETLEELGTAFVHGQKVIKSCTSSVESQMATAAPVVKVALQKLIERTKKESERLAAVLTATRGQKQKMLSVAYMKEGEKQTEEVEEKIQKVSEVELPFLKGIEVLPLKEAKDTIADSDALVADVQAAISDARTFIASKNLEIKLYDPSVAKPAAEEFIKQTERINAAAAKLSQFKKDTEARKKTAQMQEASETITKVEAEVKKLVEAAEPLTAESMTEEDSTKLCEELSSQVKEVQAKIDTTRTFLTSKGPKGVASSVADSQQKLQERLSDSMMELAKAKKVISDNEQKFSAKKLLAEANELMEKMDADLEAATATCAPLLEKGGEEFLVASSVLTMAGILRDHMASNELSEDSLFSQVSTGCPDGKVPEEAFCAWLDTLPTVTGREEVTFTGPRRIAMSKYMDVDGDGAIGLDDFKHIFKKQFVCKEVITLTDVFEISKSKTKGKLEPGSVLEALGNPVKDEATGMTRLECKITSSGKTGFVTMLGNQGTVYLEAVTPFTTFSNELETAISAALQSINQASNFLKNKTADLIKVAAKGPLVDARTEFAKLRPKISTTQTAFEALKKKVTAAKLDFARREAAEKNAHIEAREKRAADEMTAEAAGLVETMEGLAKALEDALQPLTSLQGPDLNAFSTPVSILEEAEKLQEQAAESVTAARACIKEQLAKVSKATKGPMLEAKKELTKMEGKATVVERKCTKAMEAAFTACQQIVDSRYSEAAMALREEASTRGLSPEELFASLLQNGEDRISEEAFCRHLDGLEGINFLPEHAKLLCKHIEVGGIGRRKFLALLQQYFVVVKAIAITDMFEINKAKSIRKADADEVIEVLEGPRTDEKVGLIRVKGKSLIDGQEGWITVSGNQGTPFLSEMEKPYYACNVDVPLRSAFNSEEGDLVRTLKDDEVIELLEGPKKELYSPIVRVRAKAASDGAVGWFTVKDSKGVSFAEPDGQHYVCTTSVALTDDVDIKGCNVLRKLTEGEVIALVEGPIPDEDAGITRLKGKALKDGKEGWITIKGNAGTVYAEPSSKHFTVTDDTPLQKQFSSADAETVRGLEKGEGLQVLEGPKEEAQPPAIRVKGRALSDGAVGWITLKGDNVRPWSPYFNCLKAAPLHDALVAEGAEVVRQIAVDEIVELVDGPTKQEGQELRMKVRAEKDGVIGWVTVRSSTGVKFFES